MKKEHQKGKLASKKTAGRKSLCTPQLQQTFCEALAKGHTIKDACVISSIGETTFFQWLERGLNGEKPYAEFAQLVKHARARGMVGLAESIMTDKDWRAKAWYLERTRPEDFAPLAQRAPLPELPQAVPQPRIEITEEWIDEPPPATLCP